VSRTALLVLGMHRSGTSATAGLLVRLGAEPPTMLMPADASNPEGYWESRRLWEVHERLLREADSRWDTYTRLDMDRFQPSILVELSDACRRALHDEFGDAPRFVVKDPRMCRFVPFWLRVLESEGIIPAAVLVIRHPLAVARSLGARDGIERDLSLLIWLRHVLDAEFHTRFVRRTFVPYQELIEDWRPVAEQISRDLEMTWRSGTTLDNAEIDRFVNSDLRHYPDELDFDGLEPVLSQWLRTTWAALRRLHEDDTHQSSALSNLDAVRLEFDRATSALGIGERIRGDLEAQILEHAVVRSGLQERVLAFEQRSDALQREVRAFELALSDAHQDAKALRESGSWKVTAPLRAVYRLFR